MKHILIAEDEKGIGLYLKRVLENAGYDVTMVEDGQKAFDTVKSSYQKPTGKKIDLLITDVEMPFMTGLELIDELNKENIAPPSMIVTATSERDIILDALRKGCYEFIDKPITEKDVIKRVKKVFEKIATDTASFAKKSEFAEYEKQIPDYKFIRKIGDGTSGTVYLCKSKKNDEQYALKILKLDTFEDDLKDVYTKRFINEGHAIAQLNHANIINFIEFGYYDSGTANSPYIVMEYFEGKPLTACLRDPDSLELTFQISIICQVAEALSYIHSQDILHRDIKPGNILIDAEIVAKITDFGVCRFPNSELTMDFEVLGSPGYVAPEYWQKGTADKLSDIYSLGVVAYELMLGKAPFRGDDLQSLRYNIISDYPREPRKIDPDFPIELQDILAKMLCKNTRQRYQDAAEISEDLKKFDRKQLQDNLFKKLDRSFFRKDWK